MSRSHMFQLFALIFALATGRPGGASARADWTVRDLAARLLTLPNPSGLPGARVDMERQRLLGAIYVQATLEARDADQLRQLLTRGRWTGLGETHLPALNSFRLDADLFKFLFLLTQREPPIARVAFDVLQTRAARWRGEGLIAESLVHFATRCARSRPDLEAVVDLLDRLLRLDPATRAVPFAEVFADPKANSFLGSSVARTHVVANLAFEVARRRGPVRDELLRTLAAIGHPVATEIVTATLHGCDEHNTLNAVMLGLGQRVVEPELYRAVAANLPRFSTLTENEAVLATAARLLLRPFVDGDPAASRIAAVLPPLFTFNHPVVRRLAARAIHWPGLTDAAARAAQERLLRDPDESVRREVRDQSITGRCEPRLKPPR